MLSLAEQVVKLLNCYPKISPKEIMITTQFPDEMAVIALIVRVGYYSVNPKSVLPLFLLTYNLCAARCSCRHSANNKTSQSSAMLTNEYLHCVSKKSFTPVTFTITM